MQWFEPIIIVASIAFILVVLYFQFVRKLIRKKKGVSGCSCCGGNCPLCHTNCHQKPKEK